jgi:DNA-binding transcriptional ArsR family regulator
MTAMPPSTAPEWIPEEERLDRLFGALADSTRRRILTRLTLGPAAITELARPFTMSLPAISRHIKVLEAAGLVRRERDGKWHHLQLETAALEPAAEFLDRHRAMWEGTLDQLAAYLENP